MGEADRFFLDVVGAGEEEERRETGLDFWGMRESRDWRPDLHAMEDRAE